MLNPKEEAKIKRLKKAMGELRMPPSPEVFIGIKVHDRNGILLLDDIERGHSWTRNFYNYLYLAQAEGKGDGGSTFGAGYISSKQTNATVVASATVNQGRTSITLLGNGFIDTSVNTGIRVGTGNTAFSINDHVLDSPVANGNASGQLSYQAMGSPTQSYDAGSKTWTNIHSRIMNNNSGDTIIVAETGLYWIGSICSNPSLIFMFERNVLDLPVSLINGAQLTVSYTISVDFSAID